MRTDYLSGREHPVEVVATNNVAQDQYTGEKTEAAESRDDQGHPRRVPRLGRLMPIAD